MGIVNLVSQIATRQMDQRLRDADEAHRIEGIPLVDYDLYTPYFRQTFALALQMIKVKDPRRFRRVLRYIKGIAALPLGHVEAGYDEKLQVCAVRFQSPP